MHYRRTINFGLALTGFLALTGAAARPASAQTLDGQPLHVTSNYPDISTVFADEGTQTVTSASGAGYLVNDDFNIYVTPTQMTFDTYSGITVNFIPASFNGFALTETGAAPSVITGVSIDPATTESAFTTSDITFNSTSVAANFQGLQFTPNDKVVLDLTFGPTPVPETSTTISFGLLLALGLGGMVVAAKRKKGVSA